MLTQQHYNGPARRARGVRGAGAPAAGVQGGRVAPPPRGVRGVPPRQSNMRHRRHHRRDWFDHAAHWGRWAWHHRHWVYPFLSKDPTPPPAPRGCMSAPTIIQMPAMPQGPAAQPRRPLYQPYSYRRRHHRYRAVGPRLSNWHANRQAFIAGLRAARRPQQPRMDLQGVDPALIAALARTQVPTPTTPPTSIPMQSS